MTTPALRQAWKQWRAFADRLDLSDGAPGADALHHRLFRLSGHPRDAAHLRAVRDGLRDALGPWLDRAPRPAADDLEGLRRALSASEPAWRVLIGSGEGATDWDEVERVALAAGLARPTEPFWSSPLFVSARRFEPVAALRGHDRAEALALLGRLLDVLNHPQGGPLWGWLTRTRSIDRPAEALRAAALMCAAAAEGLLRAEWLTTTPWLPPPATLVRLVEDVCLCFLRRLNEPSVPARPGDASPAPAGRAPYRRAVPDPLPVEPYFRGLPGSEAFLRAIAEEPLEDSHRLVFADWLDEHGQADRAAFIRLQCRAEAMPPRDLRRRRLTEQADALRDEHRAAWKAGLPEGAGVSWDFRRGMLEHVSFRDEPTAAACDVAFGAVDVRGLSRGIDPPGQVVALLRLPHLSRLASLELAFPNAGIDVAAARALAATPALSGLGRLDLSSAHPNAEHVAILVGGRHFPALTSLSLAWSGSDIGPDGARSLAGCAALSRLRELDLTRGHIGLEGLRALAASPHLADLTTLVLRENGLPVQAVDVLANSPFLGRLTTLDLSSNDFGAEGVSALARSPLLRRLTSLDLDGLDWVTPEALRALGRSPGMAGTEALSLSGARHAAAAVRALAGSPHAAGLRCLDLSGCGLGLETIEALAGSPHLAGLEALDLSDNYLDAEGVGVLRRSPYLKNLYALNVYGNRFSGQTRLALRRRWPFVWT
jgi:uncharacterized protein (TIGR02996 family)